jgi:hypothetical protein
MDNVPQARNKLSSQYEFKDEDGIIVKQIYVQVEDCECEFHHKISASNAKEVSEFKDVICEISPFFMQSLI